MDLQTVYCSRTIFEEIVLFSEDTPEYKILFEVLYAYSHIVIDMDEEDLEKEMMKSDSPYKIFNKREAYECFSLPNFFKNIENEVLENFPTDIFLLDTEDELFTSNQRINKGIFIFNLNELNLINDFYKPLEFTFSKKRSTYSGWVELFKAKDTTPINSAIINDNYLFKDFDIKKDENILSILSAIVPSDLKIPFHLTIITDNSKQQISKAWAVEIIKIISDHIRNIQGISPEVGIITHSLGPAFHKRVIITNHFHMYSDKGFTIFKKGQVKENTDGDVRWVYDSVCNHTGDIRKFKHADLINSITELIDNNKVNANRSNFIAGSSENRLIMTR